MAIFNRKTKSNTMKQVQKIEVQQQKIEKQHQMDINTSESNEKTEFLHNCVQNAVIESRENDQRTEFIKENKVVKDFEYSGSRTEFINENDVIMKTQNRENSESRTEFIKQQDEETPRKIDLPKQEANENMKPELPTNQELQQTIQQEYAPLEQDLQQSKQPEVAPLKQDLLQSKQPEAAPLKQDSQQTKWPEENPFRQDLQQYKKLESDKQSSQTEAAMLDRSIVAAITEQKNVPDKKPQDPEAKKQQTHKKTSFILRLVDKEHGGRAFESIVDNVLIIGRKNELCDMIINYDNTVSSRQCKVYIKNRKLYISNLGKTNVTYLNDKALGGDMPLETGDFLGFGRLNFRVTIQKNL